MKVQIDKTLDSYKVMYTDYNELPKEVVLWVGQCAGGSPISARSLCSVVHTNKMVEIPSHVVPKLPEEVDFALH